MGKGVHAGCRCQSFGKGIHQFGVDDGDCGDVVGIDTYHLLLLILVDDYIIDSILGGGSGSCGQCNYRYTLVLGGSTAFKRNYIAELGIGDDNSYGFGRVD